MRTCIADIEANGLVDDVTTIHCLSVKDMDTGENILFEPMKIREGLSLLSTYDVIAGHNFIDYDCQVIKKLYDIDLSDKVHDTLIMSKLYDASVRTHSLAKLGELYKLTQTKDDYSGGWEVYSEEMGLYCKQDVETNAELYMFLLDKLDTQSNEFILEHNIRRLQTESAMKGVVFDMALANKVLSEINAKMEFILSSFDIGTYPETFEYNNLKDGSMTHHAKKKIAEYPEAEVTTGFKRGKEDGKVVFKPSTIVTIQHKITPDTKNQLIAKLLTFNWKPTWLTPKGTPKITNQGDVCPRLLEMGGTFADLGTYYVLKHRKALIEGLIKVVREDGRIPSEADTMGAVTHRYAHRKIANFPAVRSLYGKEIRAMFTTPEDSVLIGADLAGLELRMLAHYMNDDNYTKEVLEGDIHTANQLAAGLPTRDDAKTFIYGYL